MTRCNRGVVLGNVTRWCNRAAGHKGDHLTVWLLRDFPFPEPPPRYRSDGTRADLSHDRAAKVPAEGCPTSEALRGTERPDICTDCDGDCGVCGR